MKHAIWTLALGLGSAGAAWAQDGEYERRLREMEERHRAERRKLDEEFGKRPSPGRPDLERLLSKLRERVERLERDFDFRRFKPFEREDFDFRRFAPKFRFKREERSF